MMNGKCIHTNYERARSHCNAVNPMRSSWKILMNRSRSFQTKMKVPRRTKTNNPRLTTQRSTFSLTSSDIPLKCHRCTDCTLRGDLKTRRRYLSVTPERKRPVRRRIIRPRLAVNLSPRSTWSALYPELSFHVDQIRKAQRPPPNVKSSNYDSKGKKK
jgi:hypothetical protein